MPPPGGRWPPRRAPATKNPSGAGKVPSFIEVGVSVRTTRFRYSEFFAAGHEFILTGTNFGDAMGDRGTPPTLLLSKAITGQIYPSIKIDQGLLTGTAGVGLGGRSIDEICRALDVQPDPFIEQLVDHPYE